MRRFLALTVVLAATVGLLVGMVISGSLTPSVATSAPPRVSSARSANAAAVAPALVSFADVAERLNPAVVNIDAVNRGSGRRRRYGMQLPDSPDMFDRQAPPDRENPRRGSGTGFLIDAGGLILTNHHVIADAERISVQLTDGRTLRAERVGSDPDTDIALIKVSSPTPLPFAPLGDSDSLRVGEWVLAIGNPLAYEHTVTVGVVSYIGRKLFDSALDRYIQTDAAINFGNSGGPLINAQGEVIGINSAISSRASNIGFAVPINQASAILPQLRDKGRVSRGYIGVALKKLDASLQQSLGLRTPNGVLVEDVTAGSPGDRAGLRAYDLIVAVDGKAVSGNDELIQLISARLPGSTAMLQVVRDNRPLNVAVKLAERPLRDAESRIGSSEDRPQPSLQRGPALGLSVREMEREFADRMRLPAGMQGVIVARVEPMSPAFEADIERNQVLLEINRRPVRSIQEYRRLTADARPGDILTLYIYKPDAAVRALQTVKID